MYPTMQSCGSEMLGAGWRLSGDVINYVFTKLGDSFDSYPCCFGRVPTGPGYALQVLAIRASWLRAFRCYPSRSSYAKASDDKHSFAKASEDSKYHTKGFVR
jgi:hypothetical protein